MNGYFTGTGWPAASQHDCDLRLVERAFALAEAYGHRPTVRYVRDVFGLERGQDLTDALPIDSAQRRQVEEILGVGFAHRSGDAIVGLMRHLMRLCEEREAKQVSADRTCLYRFTDESGRLLYVGVAWDPDAREKQHRHTQRWAPLIHAREDEWFDTREEALRAETHAIRNESPLFNEAGRPRLPSLVGEAL